MTDGSAKHLQHVVLLRFPEPLSAADEGELFAIVAGWEREIGTLEECRIGRDLTDARTQGFQYLLFTVFPDADVMRAYVEHPAHQRLVTFLNANLCDRLAFDYYF